MQSYHLSIFVGVIMSLMLPNTTVFAQQGPTHLMTSSLEELSRPVVSTLPSSTSSRQQAIPATVIWEEDFSNGLGNWTNQGGIMGTSNPQAIWEYRGPTTTPDTSVGTRGAYGLNRKIESLTWQNGWVIFDSDYLDNAGVVGNFGGGTVPAPHYGELISPVIDLSNVSNAQIEFYQHYRQFESQTCIVLSQDGGATWFDTLYFNQDIPKNSATSFTDYQIATIPSNYTNTNQFRFKFLFFPEPNTSFGGYYFWQVDDVRVIEQPAHDLAILPKSIDPAGIESFTTLRADGRNLNYGFIAKSQLSQMNFETVVKNNGSQPQANVVVNTTLSGPQNLSATTNGTFINPGDAFSIPSTNVSPTLTGLYEVTMTVSSPNNDRDPDPFRPNDNVYTTNFTLSDSAMGLAGQQATSRLGTQSFTNGADGVRFANILEVTQADTITSVTIGISSITLPGSVVLVTVRDTGTSFSGGLQSDFPVVLESDFYSVTAQDTANGFITVPIPQIVNGTSQNRELQPDWYVISAELYSSGNLNDIAILDDGVVPQPWYAAIFYYPPDQRWYSNGNAFHIWANFGRVEYNDLALASINLPNLAKLSQAPFTVNVDVVNNSLTMINQFDISYQIDTQPPITDNILFAQIAPGDTFTYSFQVPWQPSSSGDYTVTAWVSAVQPDDDIPTNDTLSTEVVIFNNYFPRKVLYESFTSSTCDTCATGNAYLRQELAQFPGTYAQVNYLQGFPNAGDPYGTDESTARYDKYYTATPIGIDSMVVTYYVAIQGPVPNYPCHLVNPNKVYMHSGAGTSSPTAAWEHVVGNWGQDDGVGEMTYRGNVSILGGQFKKYEIRFHLLNYYGLSQQDIVYNIGLVFRNENGTQEGKDINCMDLFIRNIQSHQPIFLNADFSLYELATVQKGDTNSISRFPSVVPNGGTMTSNYNINSNTHQAQMLDSSLIDMTVTYEVDVAAQRVSYDIDLFGYQSVEAQLMIAIVEKETKNNLKTSADTAFFQVMKKMEPNEFGQLVVLINNVPTTITGSYRFRGGYVLPANYADRVNHTIEHSVEDFTNLQVIAWLQDGNTVLQSAVGNIVNANTTGTASATVCDSLVSPSGNYVWRQTGTYLDTIPNIAGFDSIITYNVVVNQSTFSNTAPSACGSYTAPDGAVYNQSGTYQAVIPNSNNCDSTITINLTILQATTGQIAESVCGSYVAPDGQVYTQSGNYQAVIPNKAGCDSLIFINLTVNQPTSSATSITACNTYTAPDGQTYTQSGQYQAVITNSAGCDSTISIALTINQTTASNLQVNRCGSYTAPDGQVYTTSGTYQAIIPNSKGCDSVITIQATISPGDYDTIAPTVCGSYVAPDGKLYTQSGQYFSILKNQSGCDSVITVNLTILPEYRDTLPVSGCDQYDAGNGIVYTQAGLYPTTYISSQGCDSTVVLDVTIVKSTTGELFPVSCGDYIAPDGQIYQQSGQYQAIIPNQAGCDSIITINLIVDPLDVSISQTGSTLTANQANAQYQWLVCNTNGSKTPIGGAVQQTYNAGIIGFYAVEITTANCKDTSLCYAVTSVGMDDPALEVWSVYPNPTTGIVTLQGPAHDSGTGIRVRNSMGQVIWQQTGPVAGNVTIDLSRQPKGMYWVEMLGEEKVLLPIIVQ